MTRKQPASSIRYRAAGILFFVIGILVAVGWLFYLNAHTGQSQRSIGFDYAEWISFPAMLVSWPGFSKEGISGNAATLFFALVTVTNGVFYAVAAIAVCLLIRIVREPELR
jgi:hypothetical protein